MTVNTTIAKEQASGNGSTTSFSFPYPLLEDDDLLVTLVDSNGAVVSTVLDGGGTYDYSISGIYDTDYQGYTTGVNCVFNTAPPSGYHLTLSYNIDIKQATDYVDNDDFPASSHERALDKLTLIAQQMNETLGRSIKTSVDDTSGAGVILPAPAANAVIGVWDSDASAIVTGPTTTEISNAETNANTASAAASIATSAKNDAEAARDEAQAAAGTVRVSANDTTAGNLETKIIGSGLVGLSTQNDGANETRTIDVSVASQAEAEAGLDNTKAMTPLRAAQAIAALGGSAAVGDLTWSDAQTTPEDHLLADGSLLLIADFPELFAAIGTQFGGDGVTDFRIRDARGLFPRFKDHGRGLDPDGDRALGHEQADEFKSHSHSNSAEPRSVSAQAGGSYTQFQGANTGSSGGAETRPYNATFNLYVRYR